MQSTVQIDNWTLSGHSVNRVQETKTTSASSTDTPLSYRSREEEGKGGGGGGHKILLLVNEVLL